MDDPASDPRHARHVALPALGTAGVARIVRARVLVIGAGGLGCPAAQYLAAAGVGTLVLNDFDRVQPSDLGRQVLYGPADAGRLKVEAARDALSRLNPQVRVVGIDRRLDDTALAAAAAEADVVIDGSDSVATRLNVNAACIATGTPLITGGVIRAEGQGLVCPNDGGNDPCYRCLYDDADEFATDCRGSGVLGPVAGLVGCWMATEALKRIAGLGSSGGLWLFDALGGQWRRLALHRDPRCPACTPAAAALP